MSNFNTIIQKLEQFIKKYYTNELLRGSILFFAIGLLYLLATLFIEYMLWLNPIARTVLFWVFIAVEVSLFVKFILIPLTKLFKLRKGIDYETASDLIGNHFPEVNDKLLNVLQLRQNTEESELLVASIEQKSEELRPIPFQTAINFTTNTKYLKYAAIPLAIIFISFATGKINWFRESYTRVVNYNTAYEPPAPFQFFVVNEFLNAIENKAFKLNVKTLGTVIPNQVQIVYQGQSYFMQQDGTGTFQHVFSHPTSPITFQLIANDVTSKAYELNVVKTPNLVNLDMHLEYPAYTKKKNQVLKSTGSATLPEGTRVTWNVKTKSTSKVSIFSADTITFSKANEASFTATKQLFDTYNYTISTSNSNLTNYENLTFSLAVVKDAYPELNIKTEIDSLDQQSLYFYGQASDDYGLRDLQLIYYDVDKASEKQAEHITISSSNYSEFVSAFPDQLPIRDGVTYELYFELSDNDALHGYKRIKSSVFTYRKRTRSEEETKQLQEQSKTISDIKNTVDNLKKQDKTLKALTITQKEKKELNYNDKKKIENFLKRQKQQEQLMKNFNKKLQDNLDEFKDNEDKIDAFKEDLKQRLQENEQQLKKDEKLLEELEKLKDKINKEEFSQKLDELAKQNKNKKRSMQQLLELTKRFYVTKKAEKIQNQLEELSKEQEALSQKAAKDNTKDAQDKLNNKFNALKTELDALQSENRKLRQPIDIERDKLTEDSIQQDQNEAKKALEPPKKDNQPQQSSQKEKARQKQKNAAKKMKQLSEMMKQSMSGGAGGDNMQEDADMLRQILDNLVVFSFDQEALMEQFSTIDINHNQYGKFIVKQNILREHFEHVDDSLFAISLRNPKFSERINAQITEVYYNIDKALDELTENKRYQGTSSQQYAVTSSNTLANMLSNILDNIEMEMNMQPGGGEGDMQLPDIIMSQEQLNQQMKEGLQKSEEQKEGGDSKGKDGKSNADGKASKSTDSPKDNGKKGKAKKSNNKEGSNAKDNNDNENGEQGVKQKSGYGQGGNEELNGELYKIYQQQQQLRQALEKKIGTDKSKGQAGNLIKKMEEIELELINKGFTNQTLEKMMSLQHQLLKLDNATFTQGKEEQRESKTNQKNYNTSTPSQIETAKQYFNTVEILNRNVLPIEERLKKKVNDYFKTTDD